MSSFFCPFCAHICTFVLALILPPLGEACVCNPWSHRDPVGFDVAFFLRFWYFSHRDPVGFDVVFSYAFEFSAGGPGILLLTWSNKARQQDGILELATPAYLHFSEWHEAKPRTSQVATFGSHARTPSCRLARRSRS